MGRGWGPPFAGGEASFFLGLNRGKRGISIDLKQPEGLDLCLRLIDQMDVLIENFRPGAMDRLGLGYKAMHQRNPHLVYCSISGYGQDGPSRDEAAMDLVVQGSSGLLSITGTEQGESVRCGYGVTDVTAGLFRDDRNPAGAARARAYRHRPVRGRLDARRHDLHDEFELLELPGVGHRPPADGDRIPDRGAVPRVSDAGPRDRHRGGK